MILHEIIRPNSLKTFPSGVANYRNLPFGGKATRGLTGASSIGGKCAESPPMFIRGKRRKNRKRRCRNLPFDGRATRGSWVRLPWKENARSRHQRLFEENVGKTGKDVVYELWVWKVRELYLRTGKGINTPHVRHKGRQPLIECAKMTSNCFPLLHFFMFFYAFCVFYLFVVDKGVFLAPTYSSIVIRKSDLRSSFEN